MNENQKAQLKRVDETGDCDGRAARALKRLGLIEEAAKKPWKLTSQGRKALKGT